MNHPRRRSASVLRPLLAGGLSVLVLLSWVAARADFSSSTNFLLIDSGVNLWGGEASSDGFSMTSAGGVASGYSSSTSFGLASGDADSGSFVPRSQNWRWYDDEASLTPADPLADENVSPSNVPDENVLKLRLTLKETSGVGSADVKFRLQFAVSSDFSDARLVSEAGSCTFDSRWCYADGAGTDGAPISSSTLSDSDACSGGAGNGCGTVNESGTSPSTLLFERDLAKEFEFTLKANGSAPNTTYFFRAVDVASGLAASTNSGETYPSLVTGGTSLVLEISGLPASTSTEGILTDVPTTPTTIPFGTLAFNSSVEAAQRLSVTTNATQGYQLFVFQDQGLLNQSEAEIPGVSAVNTSPSGWSAGCAATSTGCYGYHAGDDTLGGGSVRFAPDDTYARLESTAREIAWSGIPVASDTVDVVYRTLVRVDQEYGSYTSNVSYVVVPVF